jgi:F-type H+-transporting ATPase subunit gamma
LAGVGLIDLKRRIKSVVSTQKITKAMGLVATVKFKTAKINLERYKPYYEEFNDSITRLLSVEGAGNMDYCKSNEEKKDMYIIITSDSGLCGSYNSNVINSAINEIEEKENAKLILIGHKGKNYFKTGNYEVIDSFTNNNVNPCFKDISEIMEKGRKYFIEGSIKSLNIVYTKFYNSAKQTVEIMKVLPLNAVEEGEQNYILFEPSLNEVQNYMIPKYLNSVMYYTISNSIASEYAIRMNSMDNANKNASEILAKLKTIYNRARQGAITQEISEIVSGAEALKD